MFPILLHIGPLKIYSFGIFVATGFLLGIAVLNHLVKKSGLKIAFILDYLLSLVVASLIFGRLTHVILKWELYSDRMMEILYFWQGGFSLWGSLIGGAFYFWYLCWRHKQDVLVWLDQLIVASQFTFVLGYIGYLLSPAGLSGNAFGIATKMPWGMSIQNLDSPYAGSSVHPIILYLIFGHIVIIFIMRALSRTKQLAGLRFFTASLLIGLLLFLTEALKWNPTYFIWNISLGTIVSYLISSMSIIGLCYVFLMHRKYTKTPNLQNIDQS